MDDISDVQRLAVTMSQEMLSRTTSAPLLRRWSEILALPAEQIAAALIERSEEAAWLRKASPFAGALDPWERERILREVRQRFESAA